VIRVVVTTGLVWLLLQQITLVDVAVAIADAKPSRLVWALVVSVAAPMTSGWRVLELIRPHSPGLRFGEVLRVHFEAAFYSVALPLGALTGFGVRVVRLGRGDVPRTRIARLLGVDVFVATLTLAGVGVLCWLFDGDRRPESGAILFAVLGVCALLYPRVAGDAPRRVTLIALATQVLGVAAYALIAEALQLGVSWVTVGWVRSLMITATMVPISIAGIGLREYAALLLLGSFGVDPTAAVAFAALVLLVTTVSVALIGGGLELVGALRRVAATPPDQPT
jgi:uncharacterized membrane protein YbhN (UPF0104 family)